MLVSVTCVLAFLCYVSDAFYLPGVAPREYSQYEKIKVKVNKLDSVFTQLPYDYYSLPFCRPKSGVKQESENFGEILSGFVFNIYIYIYIMMCL